MQVIVLLIENDADLAHALTMTMEGWGVDLLTCASESDASDLLTEIDVAPDVIVADIQLDNDKFGTDAIRNLRGRFGPLPACLISANREPDLLNAAHEIDVPLFHKPIDPETLRRFLMTATVKL